MVVGQWAGSRPGHGRGSLSLQVVSVRGHGRWPGKDVGTGRGARIPNARNAASPLEHHQTFSEPQNPGNDVGATRTETGAAGQSPPREEEEEEEEGGGRQVQEPVPGEPQSPVNGPEKPSPSPSALQGDSDPL
ncbi:hypothetical protein chiPu_0026027 [Chiloscyllium punctatum]|uniref:Uncharacterized protein n=1 Tax=Chiloscyllium punctatum TaxID=137246 RepID=A0A401TI98_CHIPU|nr:hypothetical protein [Chiloscyllium punctatum]